MELIEVNDSDEENEALPVEELEWSFNKVPTLKQVSLSSVFYLVYSRVRALHGSMAGIEQTVFPKRPLLSSHF